MPDYIDQISEQAGQAFENIRQRLIDAVVEYDGPIADLRDIDFAEWVLEDLQGAEIIDRVIDSYDSIIEESAAITGVGVSALAESLKRQDRARMVQQVQQMSTDVQRLLTTEGVSGKLQKEIRDVLIDGTKAIADYQMNALANTSMRTVSRAVFAEGVQELPDETRYAYVGPLDDRTRDICVNALTNMPDEGYTLSDIRGLEVDLINAGGWNCRHDWQVMA